MGVERRTFLCSSNIRSLSRIGEHVGLIYAPQMMPPLMEVLNSLEDQTVSMVASASKTDDAILLAKVLPGRTDGVFFLRRSCQRLLPPSL